MIYKRQDGVPEFECHEFSEKEKEYVLLIPVINEGERIKTELRRAKENRVFDYADIVICDGGSKDGSVDHSSLIQSGVNTLLVKTDIGKQGAQLRMGIWWALRRGYKGIITVDGNNKDSIEDTPLFIEKLKQGYDFVQGSRFIAGGKAVNTPLKRLLAVKLIHAPVISLTAGYRFTDTTNNFRAYSSAYLEDPKVAPLRECFMTYELLAFLSTRAAQLGRKVCEVPVTRAYPDCEKVPTKIKGIKGDGELMKILLLNMLGKYNP